MEYNPRSLLQTVHKPCQCLSLKNLLETALKKEIMFGFSLSGTENPLYYFEACSIRIQIKETCVLKGNSGSNLLQEPPKHLSSTEAV